MNSTIVYVLFGEAEAVQYYKTSLKMLLELKNIIEYKVDQFKEDDLFRFYEEERNWDEFVEIEYKDYKTLSKHLKQSKFDKLKCLFNFLA